MFIIEKPYASEFLIDTIVQNDWPVLESTAIKEAAIEEGAFDFVSSEAARDYYLKQEYPLIYSNSETAISWVLENLPKSNLSEYINFFKDKALFREQFQSIFPDFYYQTIEYSELKKINIDSIKLPVVIKPAIGFLSFGVHTVRTDKDWRSVFAQIDKEVKQAKEIYPEQVVNTSRFIIEQYVEGDEFAVDAYFDRNGEPVILNIFQHPFLDNNDVRDRIYLMSTEIMIKHMAKFGIFLREMSQVKQIKNFPMHMEIRVTENGDIIPIEVNPMRFAGWCTTDVAKYAWGINPYEYFYYQKRPDWNNILSMAGRDTFYFSMLEVPNGISNDRINGFDYDGCLANYSNISEVRYINYRKNPLFAVVFGHTASRKEIEKILSIKTQEYIK